MAAKQRGASRAKRGTPAKGRPRGGTAYRDRYAETALILCRGGAVDADLAAAFDVDVSTVERWRGKYPAFAAACEGGKAIADDRVVRSLYERATGYSHPATKFFQNDGVILTEDYIERYPPDTTACIFWLKNRQPKLWRDKHELDVPGLGDLAEALAAARKRVG